MRRGSSNGQNAQTALTDPKKEHCVGAWCRLKAVTHRGHNKRMTRKCELFGREMFGSKLFIPAVTGICERALTAHSTEGKVGSLVTNTILKHNRKYNRTYQPSNRKQSKNTTPHVTGINGGQVWAMWLDRWKVNRASHTLTHVSWCYLIQSKLQKVTLLTIYRAQLIGDSLPYVVCQTTLGAERHR